MNNEEHWLKEDIGIILTNSPSFVFVLQWFDTKPSTWKIELFVVYDMKFLWSEVCLEKQIDALI